MKRDSAARGTSPPPSASPKGVTPGRYRRGLALQPAEQTATYRTALGSVIKPGDPGGSSVIERMSTRDRFPPGMPPLASKRVDANAVQTIRSWIQGL